MKTHNPRRPPRPLAPTIALCLAAALLAGCVAGPDTGPAPTSTQTPAGGAPAEDVEETSPESPAYQTLGFNGEHWPDLTGQKVVILDHGAFDYAFGPAEEAFENLTGADVQHIAADDAGSALERAIREKGNPSFDVIYGIDNVLLEKAVDEGVFEPYRPLLADRINASYVFFDAAGPWYATPVDHGYIGVNVDPRVNLTIETLDDLRAHADRFVTQDPRTSTPGLGFLLATVATYGEEGAYTWKEYWRDLFNGGILVTSGWTEAYVQHFTGGYGRYEEGFSGEKPIVTSYTTSPAYEIFYGAELMNQNLLAPKSTFHQIQTMGIAKGTQNRAAAEAWIEFTLTDAFQALAAEYNAIYPVVDGVAVSDVYGGLDPTPGTFKDTGLASEDLWVNVERWIREWVDLYERHRS